MPPPPPPPSHSFHVEAGSSKEHFAKGAVPFAPGSGLLTFNRGETESTALIHPNTNVTRYQERDWRKIGIGLSIGLLLAILIAVAVAFHSSHPDHSILGPSGPEDGRNTLPEPDIMHDYMGHSRAKTVQPGGGMVATDHWICSAMGRDVLQEGGNAVDAAVASALCIGVVAPYASGVGGGLMMVIKRGVNGSIEVINAREPAPAAASWDMFKGMAKEASQEGGLAVAIPIELKGLELAWTRHGSLPWQRLVQPAARLARSGYKAYPQLIRILSDPDVLAKVKRSPLLAQTFLKRDGAGGAGGGGGGGEGGAPDWRPPRFGELCCRQPMLANTLDAVGQQGVQWLYGSTQRLSTLAQEIQAAGGIITEADLMFAQPLVEDALRVQAGPYELHVPPPPSSAAVMTLAFRIMAALGQPFSPAPPPPPSPSPSPSPNPPPTPASPDPPGPVSPSDADLDAPSPPMPPPPSDDQQQGSASPSPSPPLPPGANSEQAQEAEPVPIPSPPTPSPPPTQEGTQLPPPEPSPPQAPESESDATMASPPPLPTPPASQPEGSEEEEEEEEEEQPLENDGTRDDNDDDDDGFRRRALLSAIRNEGGQGEDLDFTFRLVEAMKHAFGARLALGDPGTPERPYAAISAAMATLLDPRYAEGLRRLVEAGSEVLDVHEYGGQLNPFMSSKSGTTPDDKGTSHLSVVDGLGNAVALTSTLNTEFGSCVISPSTGIILNNQMDDFSRPDTPNSYGLQPSEANYIAGGKRPLSSMSPTIVMQGGQLRMVAGGSGGPRILSSTLQTLVRILLLQQPPLAAVAQPRLHHQLLPDELKYEDFSLSSKLQFTVENATLQFLASKGNTLHVQETAGGLRFGLGVSQVIAIDPSTRAVTGVSDPRKGGSPAATPPHEPPPGTAAAPSPAGMAGRRAMGRAPHRLT